LSEIELARSATLEAGALAMRHFRTAHARWEKGPGQIVTEADLAIDRLLKERLLAAHPGDGWLSEETEDDRARLAADRVWVVDPIDGTRSFAEGVPEFTICVALLVGGRPRLGLVLNPATEELFEAAAGCGARHNGARLQLAAPPGLQAAHICCSKNKCRRRHFDRFLPGTTLSSIGSLALKLVSVAAGRFDGFLTWRRIHDWDVAAAALIVEEAGGRITDGGGAALAFNTEAARHDGLVAAHPALHRPLLAASAAPRAQWQARRAAP
jgi:myo-inositol-1(or 4)-monophosphatase